ncbi:MAG: hypothetical protein ACOXZ4_01265 [Sphaerochaetaceae bacterium]
MRKIREFYTFLTHFIEQLPITQTNQLKRISLLCGFKAGIEIQQMENLLQLYDAVGIQSALQKASPPELQPTIDSDFSLSYSQDLSVASDLDILHCIALVTKVDVVATYEINKSSVCKGFDLGFSVEQISSYLHHIASTLPPSLQENLLAWRQEFSSISMYDGILMKTDQRLGRIFKALPSLQPYIVALVDENLFLMSRKEEQNWRLVIKAAGVGELPTSISEPLKQEEEVAPPVAPSTIVDTVDFGPSLFKTRAGGRKHQ